MGAEAKGNNKIKDDPKVICMFCKGPIYKTTLFHRCNGHVIVDRGYPKHDNNRIR